jgi:hypothetical protein
VLAERCEAEENAELRAANISAAWHVRRYARLNRKLRPRLARVIEAARARAPARHRYELVCAPDGRDERGAWAEAAGIVALPCCARWRVCDVRTVLQQRVGRLDS